MYYDIVSQISGLFLILLVPGLAATYAFFPKKRMEMAERLSLAVVLSISINVLTLFAANYFLDIPINAATIIAETLLSTGLFVVIYLLHTREMPVLYLEEHRIEETMKTVTIIALLAAGFMLAYNIHQDYKYPYIVDEWQHIAEGMQTADKQGITLQNPYYQNSQTAETGFYEMGFHVLLAELFITTGQSPVNFYTLLPAIFTVVAALAAFTITYKTTKSFHTGIFAILFFISLKSNVNLLGTWFFVPLTLGIAYSYVIMDLAVKGLDERSRIKTGLAAFNMLALALIHPWTAAIVLPALAIYVVARKDLVHRNKKRIIALSVFPLLAFAYLLRIMWQGSFTATIQYFAEKVIIRTLEIPVKELAGPLYPVTFYGIVPFLLALAAIAYIVRNKNRDERIFLAWTGLLLAIYVLYQLTGKTILAPYERIVYFLALSMVPLSAIGLSRVIDALYSKVRNRPAQTVLITLILLAAAYSSFTGYVEGKQGLYTLIDERGYEALKVLEDTAGHNNVILARPEISSTVYPITKNQVVSITPAQLGITGRGLEDNVKYFMTDDCTTKKGILDKYNVNYVFVEKQDRQNCGYLRSIYNQKGFIIYRVEKALPSDDGNPTGDQGAQEREKVPEPAGGEGENTTRT